MQSVRSIMLKRINQLALIGGILFTSAQAQNINSPYSRYGLGDLLPSQNIQNRAMGGVSAAYADYQSINFANPASYGQLQSVTYDFGVEVDNLSILSRNPVKKFSQSSPIISYVNLGIPLKKGGGWGLVFGLRPSTRVKYKVLRVEQLTTGSTDESISTLFEGNGGSQQAYLGTGFRIGKLTAGFNAGFLFGSKDFGARRIFNNDTVIYNKSNSATQSNYSGLVFNGGLQYTLKLGKNMNLRLGASGTLSSSLNATKSIVRETFVYDATSASLRIDSVFAQNDVSGNIKLPSSYTAGFILENNGKWQLGADFTQSKWSQYRYFGETDQVKDNWQLHLGGQLIPLGGKSYWSNVAYRGGFTYGQDYVTAGGELPKWGVSLGAGLPMRRVAYTNQFSIINLSMEFGQRGNKNSIVKENFFRVGLGLSMSDIWFIKRKYD